MPIMAVEQQGKFFFRWKRNPTPSVGKIAELSVMGSNKLSVYPDDMEIVPETLANENITVTDAKGKKHRCYRDQKGMLMEKVDIMSH